MDIGYFYMTEQGRTLAEKLCRFLPGIIYDKNEYKEAVRSQWDKKDAFVFIMAAGIVVRTIAPYVKSKTTDPAVVVLDQNGHFAVSLLSGHLGGANALSEKIAALTGGIPVITTATDVAGVPAMDEFAKKNGLRIENIEALKYISSAMVEGKPLKIFTEKTIDGVFPKYVSVKKVLPGDELECSHVPSVCIARDWRSYRTGDGLLAKEMCLRLTIRDLVVGVGCKKDMPAEKFLEAFKDFSDRCGIQPENIRGVATIALKKDEPCIQVLAKKLGAKLYIYSKEMIETVDLNNAGGKMIESSEFVRQITGVGSVCEACAYLGAKHGKILVGKTKYSGITLALAQDEGALTL